MKILFDFRLDQDNNFATMFGSFCSFNHYLWLILKPSSKVDVENELSREKIASQDVAWW